MLPPNPDPAPPTPPDPTEYAPFYAGYVRAVGGDNPLARLEAQPLELDRLVSGVTDAARLGPYAPGKWSVREVLVHLSDSERIFAARALRIGRGDTTPLPGFEQNEYAAASGANRRPLDDVASELHAVRAATLALFRSFSPEDHLRRGIASGSPVSVRALLWIIVGHMEHHLGTLRDRYGLG